MIARNPEEIRKTSSPGAGGVLMGDLTAAAVALGTDAALPPSFCLLGSDGMPSWPAADLPVVHTH